MNARSAHLARPFAVLRALARLSRRRVPPSPERLAARAGCEPCEVPALLGWLAGEGLVTRTGGEPRLTLAGLACAVASRPGASRKTARKATPARAA